MERDQILLEIAELDHIVEMQTQMMGAEIFNLKEELKKIQALASEQNEKSLNPENSRRPEPLKNKTDDEEKQENEADDTSSDNDKDSTK